MNEKHRDIILALLSVSGILFLFGRLFHGITAIILIFFSINVKDILITLILFEYIILIFLGFLVWRYIKISNYFSKWFLIFFIIEIIYNLIYSLYQLRIFI